jgi:hypothetical protein
MENKINIAKLLQDCPSGMELDCTTWEDVTLEKVTDNAIFIKRNSKIPAFDNVVILNRYGRVTDHKDEKCRIFPKGKITWEGFQRPFKDGDIVVDDNFPFIYKSCSATGIVKSYCGLDTKDNFWKDSNRWTVLDNVTFATEKQKEKLYKSIKDNGYRWNPETKTLEKLPKFKVGDRIRHKEKTTWVCTITGINGIYYIDGHPMCFTLPFDKQDEYELVPNKFDINTLKPFESKVLVRDNDLDTWKPSFWGYLRGGEFMYDTVRGVFRQCIPYKGNEYLRGTSEDCNKYYKTWE